jgi:outer membrane protein
MKRICRSLIALVLLTCTYTLSAQVITSPDKNTSDKWDLRRCVEYALANNLSVQQSSVQASLADVDLQQSRWQQYPNADFSHNTGLQWGRSIDPTTNQFTGNQLLFQGFNLNAGITVFNWHRIRNNIIASRYAANAAYTDVEKTKNDVSLNVATYYLQVLLARQQVEIAEVQMHQTLTQLNVARKKVDAGAVPELDALTLEGQYATDSSAYITALATADQNLLQLKQVLNVDAGQTFDITTPPADQIPVEPLLQLQPETVFQIAMHNQPAQKANALRIQSLEASMKSARAAMYPTVSIGGSLGTRFSSPDKNVTQFFNGFEKTQAFVTDAGGNQYDVYTPSIGVTQTKKSFGERWDGWGGQINNFFSQSLGLSISVPIISGGQARFNYARSKLNLKNLEVTKALADQTLKNDIYKAYYSASAALEKFNAAKTSVTITQKAYDFAQKRYELGLLNTFDLIISNNNLNRAKLDMAAAQFDYVFKMKVLEFYKGQGIKLQ